MSFNSLPFLIFFPVVLFVYWILPHKLRKYWLLVGSYFFYAYANVFLLFLILSTTLVSYFFAKKIKVEQNHGNKVFLLVTYLIIILGLLFVFKYLNFATNSVISIANLFGAKLSSITLNIILPVGISFYSFQLIAYVVDVYKEKTEVENNIIVFALFISFFPQLVAGPIEKKDNLVPQFKEEKHINFEDFSYGMQDLIKGYIKKIVIADFVATYVNQVYGNVGAASGLALIIATLFFGIQIYCDFSGYSDIARGVARLMGIKLMVNFDRPYLSSSLKEFWNRWHISLNDFFKEYIYIPLGGNKKGIGRYYLNIFIVFLISGIWHGANMTFVLWGIIHGLLRIIESLIHSTNWFKKLNKTSILFKISGIVITYLLVNVVWIFFRANSISDAGIIFKQIFTSFLSGGGLQFFNSTTIPLTILCILLLVVVYYIPKFNISNELDINVLKNKLSMTTVLYTIAILLIAFSWIYTLQTTGESSFIYFQF